MNAKWTLSFAAIAFLGTMLTAQVTYEQRGKRADEIVAKIKRMDLMNQLLPLVLTKAQLDKILPVVETARKEARKAEGVEYEMLVKLEPSVDAALKEALEEQKLPPEDTMKNCAATFKTMNIRRQAIIADNVALVMAVLDKELNAGQKKAAANAIRPNLFDPNLDPSKMSDADKMRVYVQAIILDREAYDLLLTMSQKRK